MQNNNIMTYRDNGDANFRCKLWTFNQQLAS